MAAEVIPRVVPSSLKWDVGGWAECGRARFVLSTIKQVCVLLTWTGSRCAPTSHVFFSLDAFLIFVCVRPVKHIPQMDHKSLPLVFFHSIKLEMMIPCLSVSV